jgi:hypothetical protein
MGTGVFVSRVVAARASTNVAPQSCGGEEEKSGCRDVLFRGSSCNS